MAQPTQHCKLNEVILELCLNLKVKTKEKVKKKKQKFWECNFPLPPPKIVCDKQGNKTPVICLLPLPELHLLIGPVHKMYSTLEAI